jgi:hypothetical protein
MHEQLVSPQASYHKLPARPPADRKPAGRKLPLALGWVLTSAISLVAWIVCETLGGLLFLVCGVRLWRYCMTPVLWEIASPVGWAFVFVVAGMNCFAYLLWERRFGVRGRRRWLYRGLFLMVAGPVNEVVFNSLIWRLAGTPIYLYTVWPTFAGSGSLLSPLYYLTLLLGLWVEEWVPRSLASGGRRSRPLASGKAA